MWDVYEQERTGDEYHFYGLILLVQYIHATHGHLAEAKTVLLEVYCQ